MAWKNAIQFQAGQKFFSSSLWLGGSETHPTSYPVSTENSSQGV